MRGFLLFSYENTCSYICIGIHVFAFGDGMFGRGRLEPLDPLLDIETDYDICGLIAVVRGDIESPTSIGDREIEAVGFMLTSGREGSQAYLDLATRLHEAMLAGDAKLRDEILIEMDAACEELREVDRRRSR